MIASLAMFTLLLFIRVIAVFAEENLWKLDKTLRIHELARELETRWH